MDNKPFMHNICKTSYFQIIFRAQLWKAFISCELLNKLRSDLIENISNNLSCTPHFIIDQYRLLLIHVSSNKRLRYYKLKIFKNQMVYKLNNFYTKFSIGNQIIKSLKKQIMPLTIMSEGHYLAFEYSKTIINAWTKHIASQIGNYQLSILIFITDSKSNQMLNQKTKEYQKIINIRVRDLDIHPVHILSLSSQLRVFGQNQKPFFPKYVVEMAVANTIAIVALLVLRNIRKQVDNVIIKQLSAIECMRYFGVFNVLSAEMNFIEKDNLRGKNSLDGGLPSYQLYYCKNKTVLAVGNLESKFYHEMLAQLPLSPEQRQICQNNQLNKQAWPQINRILAKTFIQDTAQNWEHKMKKRDTCITAVKSPKFMGQNFLHPQIIKAKL